METLMATKEKLITELEKARENPGGPPLSERMRVGIALMAVLKFLKGIGIPADLYAPFFSLLTALQDCEDGRAPPLFMVETKTGSPGDGIDASQVKAFAAVAMELLMKNRHMKKQEAASVVARKIRLWGPEASRLLNRRRDVKDWQTVASWRDAVKKGRREEDYAATTYYATLELVQKIGLPPAEVAKTIFTSAPYWLNRG